VPPELRSPTVRRRELGSLLRRLRLERDLTVEQAAERLLFSASKLSRIETGSRAATLRDVRDMCDLYEVNDPAERERMSRLATEGKQRGWWQSYDLDYFATYVDLEQTATSLSYYHTTVVPGLLQTVDYAMSMFAGSSLPMEYTPERRDQLIDVRLRRQQVLTRDLPPLLIAVLDEAVLHREVGGPKVMADQLSRMVEASAMPNVILRVIPFSAGAHPAMDNLFTIIDFVGSMPSVVYVEGLMGGLYLEREPEVARYKEVFEHLNSIALTPRETIELMSEVGARYNSAP
jgi:transcriptional regulator with XRE-family HTH domain